MKNCFVIHGDWVDSRGGMNRFAFNITREIDNILDEDKSINVELVIPKESKFVPTYKNIRVLKKGHRISVFHKLDPVCNYFWKHITIPLYEKKRSAYGVNFTSKFTDKTKLCTIHDCIRECFPENYSGGKSNGMRQRYIKRVKQSVQNPYCEFLTVSEDAKSEICRIYNVDPERITICPNGWDHFKQVKPDPSVYDKYNIKKGEYILSAGNEKKHKNRNWIIEMAKKTPDRMFVLAGGKKPAGTVSNIVFLEYVTDEELKELMSGCYAFIQPSFYEGFGIPPMEALSTGARCIVSNCSAMPGIYGNTVHYLDPHSTKKSIDELLEGEVNPPDEILNRYTWNNSARIIFNKMKTVCEAKA